MARLLSGIDHLVAAKEEGSKGDVYGWGYQRGTKYTRASPLTETAIHCCLALGAIGIINCGNESSHGY
jgi:hypothetical protein